VPVRTTESLGPLLSERAATLGAGKLNLAFSYARLDFRRFNGKKLNSLKLIFNHEDSNGDGVIGPTPAFPQGEFELDSIQVDVDVKIKQDVFGLFATYGLTRSWDVGLVVPIVRTRMRADAAASIIRRSVMPPSTTVHNFDPAGESPFSSGGGSKTGVGDVLLRTKYNFLRNHDVSPDLAVLGQIKLPTGDQKNLLGTGETDFLALFIASRSFGPWAETRWLSPHVNLGFEWTTGSSVQNNLRYVLGFDARLNESLTMAVDTLGRWKPSAGGLGNHIVDLALGAKWNVFRDFILNTGVQIPLNRSEGLRPNVIWGFGFEYTF
jgi:hypothetical protein